MSTLYRKRLPSEANLIINLVFGIVSGGTHRCLGPPLIVAPSFSQVMLGVGVPSALHGSCTVEPMVASIWCGMSCMWIASYLDTTDTVPG